jgi:stringent starvation protein B
MTPSRPYFLRAVFDWLLDNGCTPFLAVNADFPAVEVPAEFIEDGQITLNISPSAVANFHMDNEFIMFNARFSGVSRSITVPIGAVLGIFAKENGQGMAFPDEPAYLDGVEADLEFEGEEPSVSSTSLSAVPSSDDVPAHSASTDENGDDEPPTPPVSPKKKPSLKVVK